MIRSDSPIIGCVPIVAALDAAFAVPEEREQPQLAPLPNVINAGEVAKGLAEIAIVIIRITVGALCRRRRNFVRQHIREKAR